MNKRIVVGVSGATGTIYAVSLLKTLARMKIESHLVVSQAAWVVAGFERGEGFNFHNLATYAYDNLHFPAPIASGSFLHDGMVVIPCSMKTLAGIAHGYGNTLLGRAADVTLKERRKLILVVRETPLHLVHLQNMATVASMGGTIMPPMPAFYNNPRNISNIVDHHVGRILDMLGITNDVVKRWEGKSHADHS